MKLGAWKLAAVVSVVLGVIAPSSLVSAVRPDLIIGGGGGNPGVGSTVVYLNPLPFGTSEGQTSADNNAWREIWNNSVNNGGTVQYAVINVCNAAGTIGPGCDGETWSSGNPIADWKTTIQDLENNGVTPVYYLNTFGDANTNPNNCGTGHNTTCAYDLADLKAEIDTAVKWWCSGSCNTAADLWSYASGDFYFDNMNLDVSGGTNTSTCNKSNGGITGQPNYCNETYYQDLESWLEIGEPLGEIGTYGEFNAGNWAANSGWSSWSSNASSCLNSEPASSCGEAEVMGMLGATINWSGSQAQLECDLTDTGCTGLTYTAFPSWMNGSDGYTQAFNYSASVTSEVVQNGSVDVGLNENSMLDNDMHQASLAGFGYFYETDSATLKSVPIGTLWYTSGGNLMADELQQDGVPSGGPCGQGPPTSLSGYTNVGSYNFEGESLSTLENNWWIWGPKEPGGDPTGYYNPSAVTMDQAGIDLGNAPSSQGSGIVDVGGVGSKSSITYGVVEWCAREDDNDAATGGPPYTAGGLNTIALLIGTSGCSPNCAEIDFVENIGGDSFSMTSHWNDNAGSVQISGLSETLSNWNLFKAVWCAGCGTGGTAEIALYANGGSTPIATITPSTTGCNGNCIPDQPMTFDFEQNALTGSAASNEQTNLAWVSLFH